MPISIIYSTNKYCSLQKKNHIDCRWAQWQFLPSEGSYFPIMLYYCGRCFHLLHSLNARSKVKNLKRCFSKNVGNKPKNQLLAVLFRLTAPLTLDLKFYIHGMLLLAALRTQIAHVPKKKNQRKSFKWMAWNEWGFSKTAEPRQDRTAVKGMLIVTCGDVRYVQTCFKEGSLNKAIAFQSKWR